MKNKIKNHWFKWSYIYLYFIGCLLSSVTTSMIWLIIFRFN